MTKDKKPENKDLGKLVWISKKPYAFLFQKQSERRNQTNRNTGLSKIIEEYIIQAEGCKYDDFTIKGDK